LDLAVTFKKMVDSGAIERPERTITFLWGDEMNLATLWMNSHPDEKLNVVAALDMDMVGEDPSKTGGVMRIEKTPDPSAAYNYTLDVLPWEEDSYYNEETYADPDGEFVRLPDSHTLWGAGSFDGMFQEGYFLNDLYMYAAQNVIEHHDSTFQVDVCPYEGGSDHSRFLAQNIPALLTWHFTDYTYHTSVDTLAMSSAAEMENVGITTLATALMMANTKDGAIAYAEELIETVYQAAVDRFAIEKENTKHHKIYADAYDKDYAEELAQEKEVLTAWADWYKEAVGSVAKYLLDESSIGIDALTLNYQRKIDSMLFDAVAFADRTFGMTLDGGAGAGVVTSYDVKIEAGEGGTAVAAPASVVSGQNTVLTIKPEEGYEVADVIIDGKSVGAVTSYTIEKVAANVTVKVTFKKISDETDKMIAAVQGTQINASSALTTLRGKKAVKVSWKVSGDLKAADFDGFEVFRSTRRFEGFGKKAFFTTENTKYYNTKALKTGVKYFYKVRGFVIVNGDKIYTDWSTKAWRTVK
ncbi:MAG: hypothetical protein ACI4SU_08205, partial [Anaerovoracaceae bacterium]